MTMTETMNKNPWSKTEEEVKEMETAEITERISKKDLRDIGSVSALAAGVNTMMMSLHILESYDSNLDVPYLKGKLKSITDHIVDVANDIEHRIKGNAKNG